MSQSGPRFLEWGAFRFPHRASALQRCCSDGLVSVHGVRTQLSLTCGQRRPFLPVYYRAAPIEKGLNAAGLTSPRITPQSFLLGLKRSQQRVLERGLVLGHCTSAPKANTPGKRNSCFLKFPLTYLKNYFLHPFWFLESQRKDVLKLLKSGLLSFHVGGYMLSFSFGTESKQSSGR